MERKKLKVCWISAGISSFIAGYLERNSIDEFIYIDVQDQHPDSLRFIKDCEKILGKKVDILTSPYRSVDRVCKAFHFLNSPYGAKCAQILKKRVRKEWEDKHKEYDITYVWGFDADEKHRAERLVQAMAHVEHVFPLVDKDLLKQDCHAISKHLGIKRPIMYDLGYSNNNCIGCIKGGMGYWNKIRVDFPEVFQERARLEREIGHSCIKGVFLDELDPTRGRIEDEISQECGIACQLNI